MLKGPIVPSVRYYNDNIIRIMEKYFGMSRKNQNKQNLSTDNAKFHEIFLIYFEVHAGMLGCMQADELSPSRFS